MRKERHTQAVIFIHGIGEQRPMGTVRGFVDAVLPPHEDGIKFFSRPDSISSTYELRILQNRKQPRTHFFEYYWAYKVEGTTFSHIFSWLKTILIRRPNQVTEQLLPLWTLSWTLILVTAIGLALGVIETDFFKLSGLSALLFSGVQSYVLKWAGDAARYLSPSPQNIKLRQAVRTDGINLVKKIHETGDYDRIIIVGHSLGSVIGYDILKHLWHEYNEVYKHPRGKLKNKPEAEIKKLSKKKLQPALAKVEEYLEPKLKAQPDLVGEYREAQKDLWQELRSMGNPWLITDFITLGSPLSHAAMLLAGDSDDLKIRQRQRELPTNPPVTEQSEQGAFFSYAWHNYPFDKTKGFKPWVIHHAGLFSCTRWTNFYFPAKLGLLGDIIGGPLRPWFGSGIKDIPVSTGISIRDNSLAAHNSYWYRSKKETGIKPHVQALIDALDLDDEEIFDF